MENQLRDQLYSERFARDKERIEEHERHMREQDAERHRLSELSIRMGELLERHDEKIGDHERRIEKMEQRPASRWNQVVDKIITVLAAAAVSALFGIDG